VVFILHAEADKLCLKDLSRDVTMELDQRLQAEKATREKVHQFFGLTRQFHLTSLKDVFPDTPVRVLKECFEALWMYDLAEIMEKVTSRSLRPALSTKQIEKLRKTDDRPTKYHSNVAVLVVYLIVEGDIAESNQAKKIETFFKDLNSRNEVSIISLVSSQETREALRKLTETNPDIRYYRPMEERVREELEETLQNKARAEKQLEQVMEMEGQRGGLGLELEIERLKKREPMLRRELEGVAEIKKQAESYFEKLKELEKESMKPISKAMDDLIHNQGWLTLCTYIHVYPNKFEKRFKLSQKMKKIKITLKIID